MDLTPLLLATARRSQKDFRLLVTEASPRLFAVLVALLGDREQARDALQECFARIWTRADQYDPTLGAAEAWMIAIARNHALDLLRKRKRRVDLQAETFVDPPDSTPSAERRMTIREDVARLMECLDKLDPRRAQAVRLAYLKGASYQDIASHFEIPLNTLRTWLRRGLIALKECVDHG